MYVDGARLPRWVAGFSSRHGRTTAEVTEAGLRLAAADGEVADVQLPFLPWPGPVSAAGEPDAGDDLDRLVEAATAHALGPRRVGVLLVRRGGYACAFLDGAGVTASKVGSRYVQSRTAAGGWSQQRFARRRANQADGLVDAAVESTVRILLGEGFSASGGPASGGPASVGSASGRRPPGKPDWLVTGGDRPLVEQALADPRLRALSTVRRGGHLTIRDPRRELVDSLPTLLRGISITLSDTGPAGDR